MRGVERRGGGNMNVGTWNVRTMREKGKLENVKREMRRAKMNVLGLCETRWEGVGDFMSEDYRIIYSGSKGGQKGVAMILDRKIGKKGNKDRSTQ